MFADVRRVLTWQLSIIALVAAVSLSVGGWADARSALLGGLVGFIPNVYFAAKVGRANRSGTAQDIIRVFYAGEAVKLVLTALLFIAVFQLPDLRYGPLFGGFIAVLAVFWFALLVLNREI